MKPLRNPQSAIRNSPSSSDAIRAEAERRVRTGEAASYRQACAQMGRHGAQSRRRKQERQERARNCWWQKD